MVRFTQYTVAADRFPSSWRKTLVIGVNSGESRAKEEGW